ncbi:MAG: aminotransferase class V-fold PLP-dependent enzyme [Acidobacteriota bacterium]
MEQLIYFDNAATSFPKPAPVYTFMDQFFRRAGVNPGRSGYDLCIEAGQLVEDTRRMLTRMFCGTDPNRMVFTHNSTDSLNLALFGTLARGDHAISTTLEHNSVLRPLYHLERDNGVLVDYVPFDRSGFVDPDEIRRRFKPNTRVVAINHASNVIGTVQPIAEIGRLCRERGALLVVDASQTAGKIPIDVAAMHIDLLAFTGHKSLFGPPGIGGLYVREGVVVRQTRAGGTGVRSAVRHHLEEYPYRLEFGTPNLLGIAGLQAGVQWLLEHGQGAVHAHEMRLLARLRNGLAGIDGLTLYCQDGDASRHIAVIAFNIAGMEPQDVGMMLDVDHHIACRTGLHCAPLVHEQLGTAAHGAVRFSLGPFNTEEQVEVAIGAVKEIAQLRKPAAAH